MTAACKGWVLSYLKGIGMLMTQLMHLLHLLLAFLESTEVILDKEGGVEFSDGHIIVSCKSKEYDQIPSKTRLTHKTQSRNKQWMMYI